MQYCEQFPGEAKSLTTTLSRRFEHMQKCPRCGSIKHVGLSVLIGRIVGTRPLSSLHRSVATSAATSYARTLSKEEQLALYASYLQQDARARMLVHRNNGRRSGAAQNGTQRDAGDTTYLDEM